MQGHLEDTQGRLEAVAKEKAALKMRVQREHDLDFLARVRVECGFEEKETGDCIIQTEEQDGKQIISRKWDIEPQCNLPQDTRQRMTQIQIQMGRHGASTAQERGLIYAAHIT